MSNEIKKNEQIKELEKQVTALTNELNYYAEKRKEEVHYNNQLINNYEQKLRIAYEQLTNIEALREVRYVYCEHCSQRVLNAINKMKSNMTIY